MKKDSLRFDEPQCSPAIENLYNIIRKSSQIINTAPSYSLNSKLQELTEIHNPYLGFGAVSI